MALWRKVLILVLLLLFATGLGLCLYPCINGWILDRSANQNVESFLEFISTTDPMQETPPSPETNPFPTDSEPPIHQTQPYPDLLEAVTAYNDTLWTTRQLSLKSAQSYTQPSFDLSAYGIADGIFGVISIPAVDIQMPIYLGATYDNLAAGAAHLSETSLPIGGINTNAVIAGHRGWRGAKYFEDLTSLRAGDEVTITNLWGVLRYEVIETRIIEANEIENILIQNGKDLLTLLTCYYRDGYKLRYLVICQRIE